MKYLFTFSLLLISNLGNSQTISQPAGEIKGLVTDQNGNPVSSANVFAVPSQISFEEITPRSTTTNRNGEFEFRGGFDWGAYQLYVRKEAEAYPDRSDSFYADSKIEAPTVELSQDHPSATITLWLGEKAALLAGRVLDLRSNRPLNAKLVFIDEDGNTHSVVANGKYRTLLPAGKDISVMVIAVSPDYDSQLPVVPLRLLPGQEMHMDIPLLNR